jgi:site-specific recombinase XerC
MTDSVGVCESLFLPSNRKSDRKLVSHQDLTSLLELKVNGVGWHPNQLRHTVATEVRARFGLVAAQAVLGHAKADVTQVYAERDLTRAAEVMRGAIHSFRLTRRALLWS